MAARRRGLRLGLTSLALAALALSPAAARAAQTASASSVQKAIDNLTLQTVAASSCPKATTGQPFKAWNDLAYYRLAPNGGFESGATGWTLSAGAAIVAGNEPFKLNSRSDAKSLSLAKSASATSPAACIGQDDPTIRFVARRTSAGGSDKLEVRMTFKLSIGDVTLPLAQIQSDGTWQPSPIIPTYVGALVGADSATPVTFTFVATGGSWQVDDLFVDPYKRA